MSEHTTEDDALCGAVSPTADLAIRIATYIDGHYDSDTGAWLNDALDAVLPGWLSDYVIPPAMGDS